MQPTQGTFLRITPVSSVSNGLYFLTLPLVSVMRVIYTSKGMSKKFGVRVIYRKIRYLNSSVTTKSARDVQLFKLTAIILNDLWRTVQKGWYFGIVRVSKYYSHVLDAFQRKILQSIYGPIQENGHWSPGCDNEIYSPYKDLNKYRG